MIDDLNEMLIFAEVARAGSLTRAGITLGMPKATVSRRLSSLEQRLGTRLLDKTTRSLQLTEVGEAYFERCRPILEQVEEARDFASQFSTRPQGRLRISAPADLSEQWFAGPFAAFSEAYPEISLELDLSSRRVDLISERVDVALRVGDLADSTLISRRLAELTQSLYASPGYLQAAGLPRTPEDLKTHRFVLLMGASRLRNTDTLSRDGHSVEIAMGGRVQVNTAAMLRALATAGVGIAPLPDMVTVEAEASGQLVRLLPEWSLPSHPLNLVTPSRRYTPRKTQVFIEHMLATVSPLLRKCAEREA